MELNEGDLSHVEEMVYEAVKKALRPLHESISSMSSRGLGGLGDGLEDLNRRMLNVGASSYGYPRTFHSATERWSVTAPERLRLGHMG